MQFSMYTATNNIVFYEFRKEEAPTYMMNFESSRTDR